MATSLPESTTSINQRQALPIPAPTGGNHQSQDRGTSSNSQNLASASSAHQPHPQDAQIPNPPRWRRVSPTTPQQNSQPTQSIHQTQGTHIQQSAPMTQSQTSIPPRREQSDHTIPREHQRAQIRGGRRRRSLASQRQQHSLPGSNEGLTGTAWELMASVDAATILKMNIVALDKPPAKYKTLWRQAVAEVNSAGNSPNEQTRKGAEITLALLPNMLLRAPSAQERLMSTRQKMDIRFAKFFSGQLSILVEDIQLSSTRRLEVDGIRIPRSHVSSESTYQEKAIIRAEN